MDFTKYYKARDVVKEILEKDLLGPLTEDEVINDYPIMYYIVGKLYPQQCRYTIDRASAEDVGNTEDEQNLSLDDGRVPSSMGISFSLSKNASKLWISVSAASYMPKSENEEQPNEKPGDDDKRVLWQRQKVEKNDIEIDASGLSARQRVEVDVTDGLKLILNCHKIYPDGSKTVTATLINTFEQSSKEKRPWVNQHTFFQPQITIRASKDSFTDIRKNVSVSVNKDNQEMEMLYSKHRNYVTGHGCAADYCLEGDDIVLKSLFLPVYELNQMMPAQNSKSQVLSMKYLAITDKKALINNLLDWIEDYKVWIDACENVVTDISTGYKEAAEDNIKKCRATYSVIVKSIHCLEDDVVYKAFSYANEAMFMQRKQTLERKGNHVDEDAIRWYPFQLAFFLQEIISFAEPKSAERENVDLLWFPTGGGKTEAYLGIAAFVIFLRRMRDRDFGAGVSIIMRYTLRLLTFQQFERASALICACELLRQKYKLPGGEISIGLWAGKALTPNSIEMADKILNGYPDPDNASSNPMQLEKCPWCGDSLDRDNYSCSRESVRMHIRCGNHKCKFTNGLPVHLIDEEIYRYRPSFLIATVDKFAQVAQREQSFSIFGKKGVIKPPELIIQDELHLISGPLGTITGIYEAAFKKMCTHNGIRAKVIASTATIKNAKEQINALYASGVTQFPPQGIDADDSFFAIKSSRNKRPSRMYMGCMGTGTSATTMMIRVMAATLYATRYLEELGYDEQIIDSFWTITSYFNTLRELGGAIVRVNDNVQDRFGYLKETKLKDVYPITGGQLRYGNYIELTSREKSENIGKIIQNELLIRYTKEKAAMPYDFILSSNMISVGIDIARLNTMLMVGQPKTTAEYIQATSRVGRDTPGFVFTMYNYMRSRDKSYFEQFCQYHEAFYKYVEATSVTPFAERARDRALHTLYVMLCRFYIPELAGNNAAGRYKRSLSGLEEIRDYILDYVNTVDPDEYDNVLDELKDIELEWEARARENSSMTYIKSLYQKEPALFGEDYEEENRFRVMNSMRSVETSVQVITRE
ncbi:helicase-related protein [Butyrivibrio sp. VCD2006]|uniref:helicase-related protein n=1 Tax=Butyrivibrio sp. VCD2006 TaxID=1280664 RepID=UPI000419AA1D|nr:helicase-related protein [Butyrivibrio sp. VCD2006]